MKESEAEEAQTTSLTNEELVARIGIGDPRAESLLYERFQPGLQIMLQRRTGEKSRAEDLVQDTLVTVITRLRDRGIDNPSALAGFIQQTAKYTFIGWLRRTDNQVELRDSFDQEVQEQPSAIETIIADRRRQAIREIIANLNVPRDREILYRFYVREQSKPVICEALDLSLEHFDRVINRARNRFKQLIPAELLQDG